MSNKPALIITAAVALLAIISVIITIIVVGSHNGDNDNRQGSRHNENIGNGENVDNDADIDINEEFVPDEALEQEIRAAAEKLVKDNFEIFKLFYLINYDMNTHVEPEPFGNPSEDGYRTLKPGIIEFNSVDEIFAYVDATFLPNAADVIKNFSTQTIDGSPVYADRLGKLGVNETYTPKSYDIVWGELEIELTFMSEVESILEVVLNEGEGGYEITRQMRMIKKEDGIWRLENIFF